MYWSKDNFLRLFDNFPKKWGKDNGTDLIFKHRNGDYWAVQAKCYNKKYYIKVQIITTLILS